MKKTLLDILVCPIDKYFPLECFELDWKENNIIEQGILYCKKCNRFYPIIDEIPIMLPDEFRSEETEKKFLRNNKERLPSKIINNARPWHI